MAESKSNPLFHEAEYIESGYFESVRTFTDLAEVIFKMESARIASGWKLDKPGTPEKGRWDDKVEFLMSVMKYRLDEWWIYDENGQGYSLGKLARVFNPQWEEGQSWTGNMTDEEKLESIRAGWEKAQDWKTSQLAEKLGGKAHKLRVSSMEAGISSIVVLRNSPPSDHILYRGIKNQEIQSLDEQASGMLRVGIDELGQPTNGPIYINRRSTVVVDSDVRSAVLELADNPSEEKFHSLIELYQQKGLYVLLESATDALDYIKRRMQYSEISFPSALAGRHYELMVGNIGNSPFVATTPEMKVAAEYTGNEGMVAILTVSPERISPLNSELDEKLIKGWVDKKEIAAVILANKFILDNNDSSSNEIDEFFRKAGKEIETILS